MLPHRPVEIPGDPLMKATEDLRRFVHFELDVKSWAYSPPGIDDARPAVCPCCDAPAITEGRVTLHGHGLRRRQWWGMADADTGAEHGEVVLRRYRCRRCTAVLMVGPTGMLARRRYTALAIVIALWLWAVEHWTDRQTRARVSPWPRGGMCRPERWTTLRRWAAAARDGRLWSWVRGEESWTLRQCAERAAHILAARGDSEERDPMRRLRTAIAHAR